MTKQDVGQTSQRDPVFIKKKKKTLPSAPLMCFYGPKFRAKKNQTNTKSYTEWCARQKMCPCAHTQDLGV